MADAAADAAAAGAAAAVADAAAARPGAPTEIETAADTEVVDTEVAADTDAADTDAAPEEAAAPEAAASADVAAHGDTAAHGDAVDDGDTDAPPTDASADVPTAADLGAESGPVKDLVEPEPEHPGEHPAPVAVAVAATDVPARAADAARPPARRRFDPIGAWGRGTRRAVLLGCVAALVVGAVVALVLINRSSTNVPSAASGAPALVVPPSARPAAASPAATALEAEKWLSDNVASSTFIAADSDVAAALNRAGLDNAHPLPTGSTPDWHADAYIVVTPAALAQARQGTPTAAAIASSYPVSVFGTRTDRVEVRKILPGGIAGLADRRAVDATRRQEAGAALLQNPRIHADAKSAKAMSAGGLDLRAETLLNLLAAQSDVQVTQVLEDPAERAAGQPARTVTVGVSQPDAVTTVLNEAQSGFRPVKVTDIQGGSTRLQWDVAVEPMPTA